MSCCRGAGWRRCRGTLGGREYRVCEERGTLCGARADGGVVSVRGRGGDLMCRCLGEGRVRPGRAFFVSGSMGALIGGLLARGKLYLVSGPGGHRDDAPSFRTGIGNPARGKVPRRLSVAGAGTGGPGTRWILPAWGYRP